MERSSVCFEGNRPPVLGRARRLISSCINIAEDPTSRLLSSPQPLTAQRLLKSTGAQRKNAILSPSRSCVVIVRHHERGYLILQDPQWPEGSPYNFATNKPLPCTLAATRVFPKIAQGACSTLVTRTATLDGRSALVKDEPLVAFDGNATLTGTTIETSLK